LAIQTCSCIWVASQSEPESTAVAACWMWLPMYFFCATDKWEHIQNIIQHECAEWTRSRGVQLIYLGSNVVPIHTKVLPVITTWNFFRKYLLRMSPDVPDILTDVICCLT
jgi:hypothetical protein